MKIESFNEYKNKKINEQLKKFSDNKKSNPKAAEKPQRSHVSASSQYADEVNQNIVKQKKDNTKRTERNYKTTKEEQTIKDKSIYPPRTKDRGVANMSEDVKFYGHLAQFPKNIKASKAFNWMSNLKDPKLAKKDIWYLMVEKQGNELQMVKYQQKQGVNLTRFVNDLKKYYMDTYKDNEQVVESISKIILGGDNEGNISTIKNIPNIKIEGGRKLIHKITEDLVKLLS